MIGSSTASRLTLRSIALAYLGVLLLARYLSLITVAIAVPLNTVFGVACALLLVRSSFRGKALLDSLINLPFALSPIVIGLALFLVYGQNGTGWFGDWLAENGIRIIFSTPGIVIACIFVSLPFVVREVVPVLREVGTEQEEAAETLGASSWQTFWRVTLPSIRWGVGYGVVLTTARVLGEFGAVTIVSGNVTGHTQTVPLWVYAQYKEFDLTGAYAGAVVLALLAFAALFAMNRFKPKEGTS